jgi:iron(III) transport system substrate-binding protein
MNLHSALMGAGIALSFAAPALATDPVLYTSNPVHAYEAVQAAVKTQTDLKLGVITGGSGVLLRRAEAEASAPQSDVFWSSSANTLGAFEKLFDTYASPALEFMPENLRYPNNLFIPSNVHLVTMLVNSEQLDGKEAPKAWADLADPAWKGKIILPDPANSSTGYTIVWGLSKILDEATFKAVVSNFVTSGAASNVPKGTSMGEYAIGLTFEATAYPYIDGGQEELSLVYPSEGTFMTPEFSGIFKNAPSGENAKKALDALLSKEAQIELLKVAFRRPSRSDVVVSEYVKLPELADVKVFPLDEADAAKNREAFLADFAKLPKAGDLPE